MSDIEKSKMVDLIVPINTSSQTQQTFVDKGGGEQHGLKEVWATVTCKKTVDVDTMKDNFDRCMIQVNKIISNLKNETVLGWEAESVSVGLAVSAEGSIGIATVGAEATIEVTFTPKKTKPAEVAQ